MGWYECEATWSRVPMFVFELWDDWLAIVIVPGWQRGMHVRPLSWHLWLVAPDAHHPSTQIDKSRFAAHQLKIKTTRRVNAIDPVDFFWNTWPQRSPKWDRCWENILHSNKIDNGMFHLLIISTRWPKGHMFRKICRVKSSVPTAQLGLAPARLTQLHA